MKKFIEGKTLIKNFSRSNVVLVTTISAQKSKKKWWIIQFCPPAKMIFNSSSMIFQSAEEKVFAFLKRSGALAGLVFAVGETRPDKEA